jgi:hypothetical protein
MSTHQKIVVFGVMALVMAIAAYYIVEKKPNYYAKLPPGKTDTTINKPVVLESSGTNINYSSGKDVWQTMNNSSCGISYRIPADWKASGYLGESNIVSPEDARQNSEWAKVHQDLLAKEEGDAPLGPDARSLYISCQYDVKTYLETFSLSRQYKEFSGKAALAEAFATSAFNNKGSDLALVKTVVVGGQKAYEISYTTRMPDGTPNTTYEIVVESGGKVNEFMLGHTEYDKLPETVRQIIDSITFVNI